MGENLREKKAFKAMHTKEGGGSLKFDNSKNLYGSIIYLRKKRRGC